MASTVHPTAPPAPVRRASAFWIVAAVLQVVASVLDALTSPTGGARVGPPVGIGIVVTAFVFVAVVAAVVVLCAVRMRAGRNWARIVLTVVAVLFVASAFTVFGPTAGVVDLITTVLLLVATLLAVVATVLSYLGASNRFFRAA